MSRFYAEHYQVLHTRLTEPWLSQHYHWISRFKPTTIRMKAMKDARVNNLDSYLLWILRGRRKAEPVSHPETCNPGPWPSDPWARSGCGRRARSDPDRCLDVRTEHWLSIRPFSKDCLANTPRCSKQIKQFIELDRFYCVKKCVKSLKRFSFSLIVSVSSS